ncbi:outer membrane beta-barrel protein [Brevundimonas lenta]|uniref:Outer membrane protein beta-barrel domain-containing protein n=1 Tax=Brevundimonas lenta TaxID=424796 RepID=A0A7W6JBZ1_9CAUL|nr:outer membrane beta-barrel protein [Brevundimonas lenta]MBB4082296.1 hypothetical protein [Brevundimonas lenta]
MRVRTGLILGAAGVFVGLAVAPQAQAQSLNDRWWIQGAGYWASVDSHARVTSVGNTSLGTEIDFETDLGLDENEVLPSFSGGFRAMRRLIIGLDYYKLDRSATRTLSRDIVFDDVTYPASVSLSSSMDTDIYRLTLGYAFIQNDTWEAGAALGLHATDFETELVGEASVGGVGGTATRRQKDFLAPLPTVGLFANWQVAPKVTVNGRVDYMSLEVGDYDGGVTNAQISASYRFTDHVGAGVFYRFVSYDVDITKDDWTGGADYEFSGPGVFLEVAF